MGGVIIGHEMGRALGVEAMFVERPTGTFELRRGFSLNPGDKVLMVEDVVTTGLSSREAIAAIEAAGGQIIQGPYEFPGGRRVHFTDPSGNELGVWSER